MSVTRLPGPLTEVELDRLRRLLGGEELRWLVERARARLERGVPLDGTVTLEGATEAQVEESKVADDGPDQSQQAESLVSEISDEHRDGENRGDKG